MSIAINAARITRVQVGGVWIPVERESFYLDAYEMTEDGNPAHVLLGGGTASGVCETGFCFIGDDDQMRYSGPLTAITCIQEWVT